MDKEQLELLNNVLVDKDGFKFILLLLNELGAFDYSVNRSASDKEIFMSLGKKEKGCWLLQNCFKANQDKYIELLKEKENENA